MTSETTPRIFEGLENVLVARTELSDVDGEAGTLTLRGYAIEALVGHYDFEQVCALLLDGQLPTDERHETFVRELGRAREAAQQKLADRSSLLQTPDAMTALRTALSLLPAEADAVSALGMAAVATAAWVRLKAGRTPVAADPKLGHAADLQRMMRGGVFDEKEGALLDAYLVTVADHGFNASTFAARVTASTGASLSASIVAGVCALSGPLHGGAPGPVLDMLDAIGEPGRAAAYSERELAAGRRLMGMGHRVYRVRDPRAFVLERSLREFAGEGELTERLTLARAVEAAAEAALSRRYPERRLRANVEFYTALVLEALSIPRAAFTAVFACSRAVGYAAHHQEQKRQGKLIRPSALYVGPKSPSCAERQP